jgi:hypothetical protein
MAGQPRETSWRAPTSADRPPLRPADVLNGSPQRPEWHPQGITSLGFEAFTADGDLFLLKSGFYVRLSLVGLRVGPEPGPTSATDRAVTAVAFVVASHIPPPFVWWNPISWLENAVPD